MGGVLPTQLDGVSVDVDGVAAAISYVGPSQVNLQLPATVPLGPVRFTLRNPAGQAEIDASISDVSPALFFSRTGAADYAAAIHADYRPVTKQDPAIPNEVVLLYGTGFGATDPDAPTGQLVSPAPLRVPFVILFGGVDATGEWGGITAPGLYQFNLRVPELPPGEYAVRVETAGRATQDGVVIAIGPAKPQ